MDEHLGEKSGLPIMVFSSRGAWAAWLDEHHTDSVGAWLTIPTKGGGEVGVSYTDALEVALCHGWIDGQRAFLVAAVHPTPSGEHLVMSQPRPGASADRAGEMQPAGLREVEQAQADGRWEAAYEPPSTMAVSDDLSQALDANPAAAEFFAGLDRANRYAILHRVHAAKKPETRARRIERFVAMLTDGKKLHP